MKDYKKETRPSDKPPGLQVHLAAHMNMVGVRKMYPSHEDDVDADPPDLVDNQGFECTEEAVDDCIKVLNDLGYGGKETPGEIMASRVIIPLNSRIYVTYWSCM